MPSPHPSIDPPDALGTAGGGNPAESTDLAEAPARPPQRDETIGQRDLRIWRTTTGRILVRAFAALVALLAKVWRGLSLPATVILTFVVGATIATWATEAATDVYDDVSHSDGIASLDQPVLDWVVPHRTPTSSEAITWFTDVGGPIGGVAVAAAAMLVLALHWRRWTPILVLLPGLAGALAITLIGKDLTGRGRPPQSLAVPPYEVSASFPSGHTLNATVLAGLTAYLLLILSRRLWLGALGVLTLGAYAVAMGLSRVWLGHHWLTDVIAGWLLGLAWVVGVITVHRLVITLRTHHGSPDQPADGEAARPASSRATGTRNGEQLT